MKFQRNPELILEAIKREEKQDDKGRLKVFLGMCPGVGKTYAMLETAQELSHSKNIVIGVVETHGRKETEELLEGLTIIPPKNSVYQGVKIKEMDIDAILQLSPKPDLVLVDELAHHNAPNSRHSKRYSDVEELLHKGFNVYTTVNIQHIASRNDQVAQITGIIVQETVPDSFFDAADEIELIDITPQDLLNRLSEGKVYLGERAKRAQEFFFQEERLAALRELALRFTAEHVDRNLTYQKTLKGIERPWNVNERFLVAVGPNPGSSRLIRSARRMASIMDASWIAVNVDLGRPISAAENKFLQQNLSLAAELGAEVITVNSSNLVSALVKLCNERNITQIVIGKPDKTNFFKFLRQPTLLDQLYQASDNIDIHVLHTTAIKNKPKFFLPKVEFKFSLATYLKTTLIVLASSGLFYLALPFVGYRSLGSAFLLTILVLAIFAGLGPSLYASVLFALIWVFVFISPVFTFAINSWQDVMMVALFILTALVSGILVSRVKLQETLMEMRESRTYMLYEFSQKINGMLEIGEINKELLEVSAKIINGRSSVVFADEHAKLNFAYNELQLDLKNQAVAQWAFDNKKRAGKFSQTLSAASCMCYPLVDGNLTLGVLTIIPNEEARLVSVEEDSLLSTITKQAANAMAKLHNVHSVDKIEELEQGFKVQKLMQNNLQEVLAPAAAILWNKVKELEEKNEVSKESVELASKIYISTNNILDYFRVENGKIDLTFERFKLAKLFNEIVGYFGLNSKRIILSPDQDLEIVADFSLLFSAFLNLVDNSIQYTEDNIYIDWFENAYYINISIKDQGKIKYQAEIANQSLSTQAGLGLSIAKKVIDLHHGEFNLVNSKIGLGLDVLIALPIKPNQA